MPNPTKDDFLRVVDGTYPLRITDDTQMSLCTAEALLKGYVAGGFQEAYLNWYSTQVSSAPVVTKYSLTDEPLLYSQRAPGNTCMQSLRALNRNGRRTRNDSKGNGTVMRCFPLVPFVSMDNLDELVSDCVYVTHDHIFAFWATKLAVLIGKGLSAGVPLSNLLVFYKQQLHMLGLQRHPADIENAENWPRFFGHGLKWMNCSILANER